MPLVCNQELSTWERLSSEGVELLSPDQVASSDLVELHIGFLNMMPDRALRATERQFIRLLAAGGERVAIYVHPFSIDGLDRQSDISDYVGKCYASFQEIQKLELNALVLTGANPGESDLKAEKFWPHFEEVVHWAEKKIQSIMCSCLASHAILNIHHGIERSKCLPDKRWGVYSHQILQPDHPLLFGIDHEFDAPRSHVYEMTAKQLEDCGVMVLASSKEADFHIAVSADGLKWIFLQGHPEYDDVSLLKEYKREIARMLSGQRKDYPQYPQNYLKNGVKITLNDFRKRLQGAFKQGEELPKFPEAQVLPDIENTWTKHGQILFRNWIGMLVDRLRYY